METYSHKYLKTKEVLIHIGILVFPFVLPLPTPLNIKSICFIIFLTTLLLNISVKSVDFKKILSNKIVVLFLILYSLDPILSIIRGNEFYLRDLRLSFLIAPTIFMLNAGLLNKYKDKILMVFVFGTFGYIVFTVFFIIYFYTNSVETLAFDYFLKYVTYHYLPYSIHHTYIGIYLCFTSAIILFKTKINLYVKLLLNFILFASVLIIASKLTIIFFVILFFTYFLIDLKWTFLKRTLLIATLVLSFLLILTLYIKTDLFRTLSVSINERKDLFKCSIEGINSNLFLGIGNDNVKNYIANCNSDLGLKNTHNIFLQEFLSNGVLGIIILCVLFYIFIRFFLKVQSILGVTLIVMILFFGLVEHLFNLQNGVLFFIPFLLLIFYTCNFGLRSKS
ncbi:O-antigen ligase family protein [Seonamhaeicola sp.]|uniref:O-antigen ligase family protein n=1 Tax=Seonamhaeicola sp. TaxID=1912245 RepID=UPI002637DB3D|nr:O-antigen ligase family protein [Seonamhaeicola sp.]